MSSRGENFSRIIPARAGSSRTPPGRSRARADHPRACGEQRRVYDLHPLTEGSSPRVRGAEQVKAFVVPSARIIPARAGSS